MTDAPASTTADELAELLKEVRRIKVQASRLANDVMAGGYSSAFRGAGIEFDEVREYAEGDDPRAVEWNVTARTGRPHVKKYIDERELTVFFLLDLSASMDAGFGIWSARQMAARICACLALTAVRSDDKVGLLAFSERVDKFVPPKQGVGHVLRIVRDCLVLRGSSERTDVGTALDFVSHAVRRRAVVFVVSDYLSDGWQPAMQRCARRHDVVAVRMAAPELAAPAAVLTRLVDPETGARHLVDWSDTRVRAAYAQRVAGWRSRTNDDLRRAGVDRIDVPIPRGADKDAVARPILAFFRMRAQRGAKR